MSYRAALIGLGRIADTIDDEQVGSGWLTPFSHMGSYAAVPEVQVVGAADAYAEQRAAFGRRWGIARGPPLRGLPGPAGAGAPGRGQRLHLRRPAGGDRAGHRPDGARGALPGARHLGREAPGPHPGRGGRHGGGLPGGGDRAGHQRHARLGRLLPPGPGPDRRRRAGPDAAGHRLRGGQPLPHGGAPPGGDGRPGRGRGPRRPPRLVGGGRGGERRPRRRGGRPAGQRLPGL